MELTGRLTSNAEIKSTKDGRRFTRFSIAINDRYHSKEGEWKQLTTYINCSYWLSVSVAPYLKKGVLVELAGRISTSAWINSTGPAKGSLDLFVNVIKIHGSSRKMMVNANPDISNKTDDLPF